LYGKIPNGKIDWSCGFERQTFLLSKILSADGRASASNFEKRTKKSKFFNILEIFSKVVVQKLMVYAFMTRLKKLD
jgi:hypothetical protein